MSQVKIYKATPNDTEALIEAGEQLFDYPVKINRLNEFFSDPRHHLILASIDQKIVGMASALDYIHPDKDPSLFINEVSVLPKYRNQGIGRALVKYLKNYGEQIGCTEEIWLATEHSNLAARKAYLAAGGKEDDEAVVLVTFDINEKK